MAALLMCELGAFFFYDGPIFSPSESGGLYGITHEKENKTRHKLMERMF